VSLIDFDELIGVLREVVPPELEEWSQGLSDRYGEI
jgi:hypothetical protein